MQATSQGTIGCTPPNQVRGAAAVGRTSLVSSDTALVPPGAYCGRTHYRREQTRAAVPPNFPLIPARAGIQSQELSPRFRGDERSQYYRPKSGSNETRASTRVSNSFPPLVYSTRMPVLLPSRHCGVGSAQKLI